MANRQRLGFVTGVTKAPSPTGSQRGAQWLRVPNSSATKAGFTELRFGYQRVGGGWRWTGLLIESSSELTGRRLKAIPQIGTIADLARGLLEMGKPVRVTAPRGRGRPGHSTEYWQQVAALRKQALEVAPRKYVKWMREHLTGELSNLSEDTIRRYCRLINRGEKP